MGTWLGNIGMVLRLERHCGGGGRRSVVVVRLYCDVCDLGWLHGPIWWRLKSGVEIFGDDLS
jgi:hypothetical protein